MSEIDGTDEAERILNSVSDCFYCLGRDWTVKFINTAALRYFDKRREDVVGRKLGDVFPPILESQFGGMLKTAMEGRTVEHCETWSAVYPDRWIDFRAFPIENGGVAAIWRDETKRKRHDDAILETLRRQEDLYRELNHRIANGLQSVVGIVRLSARSIGDDQAKIIVTNAVDHIIALSLVHRRLYQSQGVERQEVKEYLETLCRELSQAFHSEVRPCGITCEVEPGLYTLTDTTLTIGLMLSELVMNSIKHSECAHLRVSFYARSGQAQLQIADDGIGFPEDFNPSRVRGIGIRLAQAWAKALNGKLEFVRGSVMNHGTTALLTFPMEGRVVYDPEP